MGSAVRAGAAALVLGAAIATPAFAGGLVTYEVQPGDTLSAIAGQYGVSVAALSALNSLPDPNQLAVGQVLTIQPASSPASSPPATASQPFFPHYPGFAINNDGVVTRALSPVPPPPPPPNILNAPYYNQFDGTIWAESNCGPTNLSMALAALGVRADQLTLRAVADRQMGSNDPANGTTWESLVYAASQYGVRSQGLYATGQSYRAWSLSDLKSALRQGRPVILLVRFWDLPEHVQSTYAGDHYILALGFDRDGYLIYHDSAVHGDGSYETIDPTQLMKAWSDTYVQQVRTAMALYR